MLLSVIAELSTNIENARNLNRTNDIANGWDWFRIC